MKVLPMRSNGLVDVEALSRALEEARGGRTLVALTHVQTGESTIQPAAEVGAVAKAYGATFLLDSCQTIGQLPLNVNEAHTSRPSSSPHPRPYSTFYSPLLTIPPPSPRPAHFLRSLHLLSPPTPFSLLSSTIRFPSFFSFPRLTLTIHPARLLRSSPFSPHFRTPLL